MMRNVWAVVRREYLQRVRSKWFIFSTVGGPLLMIGMMVIPGLIASRSAEAERVIAVVDRTGVLAERVLPRLEDAGYEVSREAWTEDVVSTLAQVVTDEKLGGFLLLDDSTLVTGQAVFYSMSRPSGLQGVAIRSAVSRSALEALLDDRGVDAGAMASGGDLRVELLATDGAGFEDPQFLVAYLGTAFLYFVIFFYSVAVMRATLEEKTSRVVEVIISSMKPWHLMLGKILGVGAVGLTQMAVWVTSGVLIVSSAIPMLLTARPELAGMEQIRQYLPGLGLLSLFLGFFVFGYFIYSALYAAVGAMCNTEEETQQAQFPIMFLVITPVLFMIQVIQSPNSTFAVTMSLIPFFSPILMFARASVGGAPAWQVALSFALMAAAVVAVAWMAGRIYKVGILMAGKRPTLPELWRWVREA